MLIFILSRYITIAAYLIATLATDESSDGWKCAGFKVTDALMIIRVFYTLLFFITFTTTKSNNKDTMSLLKDIYR